MRVTLHLPKGAARVTTPLVFIGNNQYEMSLLSLGKRESLDGGELWLYVASHRGRVGFVSLALRAVIGRLDQARDFLGVAVPEVDDRGPPPHDPDRVRRRGVRGRVAPALPQPARVVCP